MCGLERASEPLGASDCRRTVVGRRRSVGRSVGRSSALALSLSFSLACSRLASRNGNEFLHLIPKSRAPCELCMTRRDATGSKFSLRAEAKIAALCLLVCGRSASFAIAPLKSLRLARVELFKLKTSRPATASEPNGNQRAAILRAAELMKVH